jgi:hypothetical protein
VLESTKAELQKVKRGLQEALNYKHLYEESMQQQNEQQKEMNQLLQQEKDDMNQMALLPQENNVLMEELTKERGHVRQLLPQLHDQLKENQQLLAENAVTPAFLAPNKSPTKTRVFSKPSR